MYQLGEVVRLRKKHPCGEDRWKVLKTGVDMRIKCLTCGRVILLPRHKLEKQVKERLDQSM